MRDPSEPTGSPTADRAADAATDRANDAATDIAFAGIARQAKMIRDREISPRELTDLYLDRIERHDPTLNAFRVVLHDAARAYAGEAERRVMAGESAPLLGVPVAFKDEVDIIGTVNMHGTAAFDAEATVESAQVRKMRNAGAVVIGKTNLPELAICGFTETDAHGLTRNPWNIARTPGGSSGGSAAAVAAGLVGAASASDGMGSIRIPAALTGIFGLKPQRGRISLAPLAEHWRGLSSAGCVSRHVADTALWLDIMAGSVDGDAHAAEPHDRPFVDIAREDPGSLRVAWSTSSPRALLPPVLDPDVKAVTETFATTLASLGHRVEERDPNWGRVGDDMAVRYLASVADDVGDVPHPERLEARTRGFGRLGSSIPASLARRALDHEAAHAARLNEIFDHVDVLVMPATGTPAVEVGRWAGQGALRTLLGMSRVYPYTGPWNYTGQPAASIPAGVSSDGLPVGVQVIAPPHREDVLLRLAAQLERAIGWPTHRPPIGR